MNNNWGSFLCPQCKNNKIEENDNNGYTYNYSKSDSQGYQFWMNRKIFIKKEPKTEWIFYKEKDKKWKCCSYCKLCRLCGESLICCCTDTQCNAAFFLYPCSFVFYILLCFICDLCSFLCCGKMTYFGVRGKNSIYSSSEVFDDGNIWDEMGGLTEEEMNKKKIWLCSNCKYYNKSFTDFIPKNNVNDNNNNTIMNNNNNDYKNIPKNNINNENIHANNIYNNIISINSINDIKDLKNLTIKVNNNNNNPTSKSDRLLNDEMMAINFTSDDQVIHFCLPCKKSDKFSILEKKLFEEYPQYKNKEGYFIANGNIIDKKKTLEENKIKSGDTIMLSCY